MLMESKLLKMISRLCMEIHCKGKNVYVYADFLTTDGLISRQNQREFDNPTVVRLVY